MTCKKSYCFVLWLSPLPLLSQSTEMHTISRSKYWVAEISFVHWRTSCSLYDPFAKTCCLPFLGCECKSLECPSFFFHLSLPAAFQIQCVCFVESLRYLESSAGNSSTYRDVAIDMRLHSFFQLFVQCFWVSSSLLRPITIVCWICPLVCTVSVSTIPFNGVTTDWRNEGNTNVVCSNHWARHEITMS